MTTQQFTQWGWRIPFLVSSVLLVFSIYIRLKLQESPVFQKIKSQGQTSKAPLTESFANWSNLKIVLLALIGATAGQGVVWYTGQFYALFFLIITLKLSYEAAYLLIALSLIIGTPFFVLFGRLSDIIGRKKIIMAGCLIAALTYFPLFKGLTHYVNPALEEAAAKTPVSVTATDCHLHVFVGPWSKFTPCDRAKDFLTKQGISFATTEAAAGSPDSLIVRVGNTEVKGWNESEIKAALTAAGFPASADKSRINYVMAELILVIMVIYVTMVYGPIAAFLVELFPARIRYTSMSLPYHIGNGWFGGMLPLLATAMVAAAGNIYYGLWYPILVAAMTFVVGTVWIKETKDHKVRVDL